ncbi:hypothetical protein KL949_000018 [Ogataea haglerorum]|nr:hypothetical protein KL913_000753 [Ogataea haglerorum]KAG7722968.1 hypothetical protein KL949_000018 [Ogataea haglerorum]KAG7772412.1 hypothetical protein KL931_000752 [Ogataea haglerorum]
MTVTIQRPSSSEPLYPDYLPFYDPLEKVEDIGKFVHHDPGHRADPAMPNLLKTATVMDLSPCIGTEIGGTQLSQLTSAGLDELALLAAQRGVVVLRDQDYADIGFERQLEIARHFGPLHIHGWAPHPANGSPEFMIIYDDKDDLRVRRSWKGRSPIQFHSDQSAEPQTPGTTILCMLECPPTAGGDTIFSSGYGAYERLSPKFRKRLEGLRAVHCNVGVANAEISNNGMSAIQRRDICRTEHPVVVVHPVTKKKALFVTPVYTESIVGMQKEESDALLSFLFGHIIRGQDFACRVRYDKGTVVVWDQRITCHSQTLDYPVNQYRRHGFRLTPLANRPIPAKEDSDDERLDEYLYT